MRSSIGVRHNVGMDNAVALVRAYLQLNGYFTITEYPIVRRLGEGRGRSGCSCGLRRPQRIQSPEQLRS